LVLAVAVSGAPGGVRKMTEAPLSAASENMLDSDGKPVWLERGDEINSACPDPDVKPFVRLSGHVSFGTGWSDEFQNDPQARPYLKHKTNCKTCGATSDGATPTLAELKEGDRLTWSPQRDGRIDFHYGTSYYIRVHRLWERVPAGGQSGSYGQWIQVSRLQVQQLAQIYTITK
jgi:hypothetical protein